LQIVFWNLKGWKIEIELLYLFFQQIPKAPLFLSLAIGYWISKIKIGNISLGHSRHLSACRCHDLDQRFSRSGGQGDEVCAVLLCHWLRQRRVVLRQPDLQSISRHGCF